MHLRWRLSSTSKLQTMSSGQEAALVVDAATTVACGKASALNLIDAEANHDITSDTTIQHLVCSDLHENCDDRPFVHLDSKSNEPISQKMCTPNPNVADKACNNNNITSHAQENDVKSEHAHRKVVQATETDHAFSCVRKGNLIVENDSENTQTLGAMDVEADCANDAAEKTEGSELGVVHSQGTEEEKKPSFGNAESLRFQNSMFEVIEEVRIRRAMDADNEMKTKQFMTEKQFLDNKYEEAVAQNEVLHTEQVNQVAAVKKDLQSKMSHLCDENARYATRCEATDKEMKSMKNEIRAFQLSKYTLEKRLSEMAQKLHLQTTTKDSHLCRLAELDTLADTVNRKVTGLSEQQDRLETNVVEAEKLNRKLTYVNCHQTCLMEGYKTEIAQLQQDLMRAKVKVDQQPADLHCQQLDIQHKVKVLEDALNSEKEKVVFVSRQLSEKRCEHKRTLELLTTSHSLVEQQVTLNNHSSEVAKSLAAKIDELNTQLTSIKLHYDATCKKLDVETQSHEKTMQDWKTQQDASSVELKTLQREQELLTKRHTDSEDVNTRLAEKNDALLEDVTLLKDELNKPKCDVALQTEVEVTDVALQTELEVTESSFQTQEVTTSDTETQTDGRTADEKSSQTEHVTSAHQFVQTDGHMTEASEEGRKDGGDSSISTSTESAHTPSVLQTTRQDSSSDTHRTDTAITHPLDVTAVVSHASNSHQSMELDKCVDVQTPVDESPSPGKASNTTPSKDDDIITSEPRLGDAPRSGDLSPQSRFTASLKSLGRGKKVAVVTEKGDDDSIEIDTKRRRLSVPQPDKPTTQRYTFQFIDSLQSTAVQTPTPEVPEDGSSRTNTPIGILHDPNIQRRKSTKRVTFVTGTDTAPAGGSTESEQSAGSFDQLQQHWRNLQEAFDENLKPEASVEDDDDNVLFSDDEQGGFELGSQVERIEHFLLSDRLKVSKQHKAAVKL